MARIKHGPYGPIVGKLGANVGYVRLGQPILRMIKHPTHKPPTLKQLAARARFKLVSGFIAAVNDFTNMSFKPLSRKYIGKTAQNMAISVNMASAITGEYPDYALDPAELVLSRGGMQLPENCAVELLGEKLRFSWLGGDGIGWPYSTEQVMMLAYYPESRRAEYIAGGARRTAGEDFLPLHTDTNNVNVTETCVETYIAFVSNDRTDVSDSLYLGAVTLA
jgi:hypothetical protein